MTIKMARTKHKPIQMLEKILAFSGSRSHANAIRPMRAKMKPRKERRTHNKWHRDNSRVGGGLWKGPTCINCGLKGQII